MSVLNILLITLSGIEIDEGKFGCSMYNRGRYVGIRRNREINRGEFSCGSAAKRCTNITTNIRPGRVVYSDEWWAYSQLQSHNYSHLTVKHSLNFVDPVTGAHTQCVERMWSACKQMLREEKTMHSTLFETYLLEFMCRQKFDSFLDIELIQ